MASTQLLPFQRHILEQLTAPGPESDGLVLLARGLGLRAVLCSLLETYAEEESLVVVVNATPEEEIGLGEELGMKLTTVAFEMPAKDRQAAYKKGGVVSITTRILIVDLLLERIPVKELTGIVVLHAEHVTPTSMEAFVMRVFREKNKTGFIKAFSDEPESFTFGVAPLQTVLTQLHIRHVFLYPRFHELVNKDLEKQTGDVINLHQPLSDSMDTIQTAIIECMDATLAELKRSNTVIEVEDLTVQNALFRSFDAVIKKQLDPHWHRIGPKTRGLVYDLATLRKLLTYLLSFDAVTFNQFLETIVASNTTNFTTGKAVQNQSPWLFLPAADTIIETARNRVYRQVAVQPEKEKEKEDSAAPTANTGSGSISQSGLTSSNGTIDKQGRPISAAGTLQADLEQDDEYWGDGDDSLFRDPGLLAASQSAPIPISSSPTAARAGETAPAGATRANTYDLTLDEETNDNAADIFRTYSTLDKGKGKESGGPSNGIDRNGLPANFYNSKKQNSSWAYWCPPGTQPVLEEQPKWFLLREILEEIEEKIHWSPVDFDTTSSDTILVMCGSISTATTLRKYLTSIPELDRDADGDGPGPTAVGSRDTGARDLLLARANEYFLWKGGLGKMSRNIKTSVQTGASALSKPGLVPGANQGNTKDVNYESAAMKRKGQYKHGQPVGKRRRVRGGGKAGSSTTRSSAVKEKTGPGSALTNLEIEAEEIASSMAASIGEGTDGLLASSIAVADDAFDVVAFDEYFGLLAPEETVVIRAYAGDEDDQVLQELRPRYIILFDPDPSFIRRLETYRAAHPGLRIMAYFMIYANSAEEQKYLSSIRRERESFERLIRERSSMAIPLQAERRPNEDRADDYLRTVSTRVAGGGRHARADSPKVVVDVREFRSSLPSLLHAAGFIVEPLTLTIGDYVLSPEMAVERKSLPDLIQSFNSGRLYQQCEVMSTHYKIPILLIEFDQKKSFSLETYSDARGNASAQFNPSGNDTDLHAKLVLLTLTFPRVRIIWSSSPYATADIFADLKANRDEPDATKAAAIGAEESGEGAAGEAEAITNQTPQEILRSLPGITSKNYTYLMKNVENFEELSKMSLEDINRLIGVEAGRQLYTFLNHSLLKGKGKKGLPSLEDLAQAEAEAGSTSDSSE